MAYKEQDFKNWITADLAAYDKVRAEYDKAREYVENKQTPSDKPESKEYVQYNLLTDRVARSKVDLVSSQITPAIKGGGEFAQGLRELFNDILEGNKFQEEILPEVGNYFYTEGFCGLKYIFKANVKSEYGLGKPEIHFLRPGELLLDSEVQSGMHTDDQRRIHVRRETEDFAKKLFPDDADDISESSRVGRAQSSVSGIKYVYIYEIEYRELEIVTEEVEIDGQLSEVRLEKEVYKSAKIVNEHVLVEGPSPTGYPTFRLIPLIHTPRISSQAGAYSFGIYAILGQSQDMLNVTYSVMLDAVKASIKQLITLLGGSEEDRANLSAQSAKTNGVYAQKSPQGKIGVITGNPIPPALIQWGEQVRFMVDEISGQYAPNRGQVSGDLSGRAIGQLRTAGSTPEISRRKHLEGGFTNLAICIFHSIMTEMKTPFSIFPTLQGNESQIDFNKVVPEGTPGDAFHVSRNGYINSLTQINQNMRIKIDVDLNPMDREERNLNVALLLRERGDLSLIDELKAAFPNTWQEKLENVTKENMIQGVIQEAAEADPKALEQLVTVWNEQIKPQIEQAAQKRK